VKKMTTFPAAAVACLVAGLAGAATPDLEAGKVTFDKWCGICHGEGRYMGGTNGLRNKYKEEKPALLEQRKDLPVAVVKVFVRSGVGIMAPFRKTEITDAELEDLAAYLARNTPR
jgi:mono/diheme cytochrome c family protein